MLQSDREYTGSMSGGEMITGMAWATYTAPRGRVWEGMCFLSRHGKLVKTLEIVSKINN